MITVYIALALIVVSLVITLAHHTKAKHPPKSDKETLDDFMKRMFVSKDTKKKD